MKLNIEIITNEKVKTWFKSSNTQNTELIFDANNLTISNDDFIKFLTHLAEMSKDEEIELTEFDENKKENNLYVFVYDLIKSFITTFKTELEKVVEENDYKTNKLKSTLDSNF